MKLIRYVRARLAWLVAALLVVAAIGGFVVYRQNLAEQSRREALAALRTEVVERGSIRAVVSATGSVLPEVQTNLAFVLPGTVDQVLVDTGDMVQVGQVLARLQMAELRLAELQAADALTVAEINRQVLLAGPTESDVAVATANLRAARIAAGDAQRGAGQEETSIARLRYDNLRADYQSLADQYNGAVQLAADNPAFALPQDTLDALRLRMESAFYMAEIARLQAEQIEQSGRGPASVAGAQVVQAQAILSQTLAAPSAVQIERAELAISQAEAALERARLRLAQAELTAPHDGVVASVGYRPGEPARGGAAPGLVLLDTTVFHLNVNVDEVDVARLSVGQPVVVRVDALSDTPLTGYVERLAPLPADAGGLVSYAVRIALDATTGPLRAGMSATAEIVVAEVDNAVLLPNWAIRRDRRTGQAFASLRDGDSIVEVPIVTGLRGDTHTEVLQGVQPGDIAAISTVRDGFNLLGGG
jgi:HlyD family secretion protein